MRNIISINQNWYFSKEATAVPETLCTDWEAVNVPHCWNAVDGQDGGNDYFRGSCLYTKTVRKSELGEGLHYLEIRGANRRCSSLVAALRAFWATSSAA